MKVRYVSKKRVFARKLLQPGSCLLVALCGFSSAWSQSDAPFAADMHRQAFDEQQHEALIAYDQRVALDEIAPEARTAGLVALSQTRTEQKQEGEPEPAASSAADQVALLKARAALAQAKGERLQALSAYTTISQLQPDNIDARKSASLLLANGSAATTAWQEAQAAERERPGTFSPLDLARLQQQALAQQLRWAVAARDQNTGMARFAALDRVLAELDAALSQQNTAAVQAAPSDEKAWRDVAVGLQSDRLLALLERGRPEQTIALYDTLRASGTALPPYALVAVASALAQERRSVQAVPLYEAALLNDGGNPQMPVEARFGLIYAYLDTGRFADAEALLAQVEADTPAQLRLTPEAGRPNPEYSSVSGVRGFFLLYTGRAALAQQHFDTLIQEAPSNASYAEGSAEAERSRGHPRAALAQFEALVTAEPYDPFIRAGYGETLLELDEFAAARRVGQFLAADYPDSVETRKFERQYRASTAAFLEVNTSAETGGATFIADKSWRLDSRLSSGLLADAWRVFYDQSLGWGDTTTDKARWSRGGLGAGWQRGGWLAEGKLQRASTGPYRTSGAGLLSYQVNDNVQLSAALDGNSEDVSWKARVADIGARDVTASASYRVNESRRFDASWRGMAYSDTNRRHAAAVSWRERLIDSPDFQLESLLSADASRNSLQNTPYFSPRRDASAQAALRGQWLTWKSDERQFFQVAEVSGGGYKQTDFSTKSLWSLRYEHQWNLGQRMQLRYGLSVSSHPYDGVREQQRNAYLSIFFPLL